MSFHNAGGKDRLLRIPGAEVLAALAMAGVGGPAIRIILAVVAAILAVTRLTGFCLVYQIGHFRTLHRSGRRGPGMANSGWAAHLPAAGSGSFAPAAPRIAVIEVTYDGERPMGTSSRGPDAPG